MLKFLMVAIAGSESAAGLDLLPTGTISNSCRIGTILKPVAQVI